MWTTLMEWLEALRPLLTNVLLGYWVYLYAASHHYALILGVLSFFVFCEIDGIKRKIDFQANRVRALHERVQRYNELTLRLSQRRRAE